MTAGTLAARVAEAFNRHGRFTALTVENNLAVDVRHIDTGQLATRLWLPDEGTEWMWSPMEASVPRELDPRAGIDEVVRAVATSVLDERPKR